MSNLELWREDVEIFFQCCKIDLISRFGIFNSTILNGEWETRLLTFLLLLGLIYRFQDRLNNVLIVVSDAWNRYRPRQQAEMIGETRISSKKSGRCRARFVSSHRSKKKMKARVIFFGWRNETPNRNYFIITLFDMFACIIRVACVHTQHRPPWTRCDRERYIYSRIKTYFKKEKRVKF